MQAAPGLGSLPKSKEFSLNWNTSPVRLLRGGVPPSRSVGPSTTFLEVRQSMKSFSSRVCLLIILHKLLYSWGVTQKLKIRNPVRSLRISPCFLVPWYELHFGDEYDFRVWIPSEPPKSWFAPWLKPPQKAFPQHNKPMSGWFTRNMAVLFGVGSLFSVALKKKQTKKTMIETDHPVLASSIPRSRTLSPAASAGFGAFRRVASEEERRATAIGEPFFCLLESTKKSNLYP